MSLKINGVSHSYDRKSKKIRRLDLTNWLASQNIYPKFYWRDRQTLDELAAVGSLLSMDETPHVESSCSNDVRFYGGMHFPSSKQEAVWKAFGTCRFWLPACEIVQTNETKIIFPVLNENTLDTDKICEARPIPQRHAQLLKRHDDVSLEKWKERLANLHGAVEKGAEPFVFGNGPFQDEKPSSRIENAIALF